MFENIKIWICQIFDFSGCQKRLALAASDRMNTVVMAITARYMLILLITSMLKYMLEDCDLDSNVMFF